MLQYFIYKTKVISSFAIYLRNNSRHKRDPPSPLLCIWCASWEQREFTDCEMHKGFFSFFLNDNTINQLKAQMIGLKIQEHN